MKKLPWMIVAALLLCGCTDADWDHLASFDSPPSETRVAQSAPESSTPVAEVQTPAGQAAPQLDVWCQQVAQDALTKAARNGFDSTTQQSMAKNSYHQCAVLKSDSL
jgi:hypothetical protein